MKIETPGIARRLATTLAVSLLSLPALAFAAAPLASPLPASAPPASIRHESTLIVNARVVDGTGAPALANAAVRIQGERIVEVGQLTPRNGERTIDAGGRVLAPGFIDTHSHHDRGIETQRDVPAVITQGVTTIVIGQDGGHKPLGEFFAGLEADPVAVNVASYVGHGTVRRAVMGDDYRRAATPAELERMRLLVREGMQQGGLGLSTGLEYDPGIYSARDEVVALAREAASVGGRYISHMRSEDRDLWRALEETIDIGRVTGMPVQVSHMKLAMTDWWGQADRYLGMLDSARAEGIDVTGDVYPYEYWHSWLSVLFPDRDFQNRGTTEFVLRSLAPAEGIIVSGYKPDPTLVGKRIPEIARLWNMDDAAVVMRLLTEADKVKSQVNVVATSMREDDVAKLIAWPHSNICSDGNLGGAHPRGAGAFTRVLRVYMREKRLLSLEQAVHKMSGAAAAHMGLGDRGVIRAGAYADLVLLDPETVADKAVIGDSTATSVGIERVWVNGALVLDGGKPTGVLAGKPLRRVTVASSR